jgi:uncharacterized protein YuzE
LKIEYDAQADAAYIYLDDSVEPRVVKKTCGCDPVEVDGMINLDFDDEGRILGVEVMDASARLPKAALKQAIRI